VTGEVADDLTGLRQRLEDIAEELASLALERLREAARQPDAGGRPEAASEERRLTRARRAVERALAALAEPDEERAG
jgi:uncharacterized membrane protein YccC